MIKTKVAFLEGRLLSSQSEQLKMYSKTLIGWIKSGSPKNTFVLTCKQAIIICIPYCTAILTSVALVDQCFQQLG